MAGLKPTCGNARLTRREVWEELHVFRAVLPDPDRIQELEPVRTVIGESGLAHLE
jgi:hypothetical protein